MTIAVEDFGVLPDGRKASLFRIDGGEGVGAAISDYGGIITSLKTPDRKGEIGEIGLGYATLDQYVSRPNYYGALIGRVANRIRRGTFTLENRTCRLNANDGDNHLHGGFEGFNRKLWRAELDGDSLVLSLRSPDGDENYPGNLDVTVRYTVSGSDLRIEYRAVTDKTTIVNLTNHEFFNLNCCESDILSHQLRINAGQYTPVDSSLVPTGGIASVAGTPFDFRQGKAIGRDMAQVPGGFDHNFVLDRAGGGETEWLVEASDPLGGRMLQMATTEPCVQFYAGNFLDGSDVGIGGKAYRKHFGFCLEAQKHPDAVNHPGFASTVLQPGQTYNQTTVYRFGIC